MLSVPSVHVNRNLSCSLTLVHRLLFRVPSTSALGNVFVFVLTFALSHHKSSGPDFNLTLCSEEDSLSSRPLFCGRGSLYLTSAQEQEEGGGAERDCCSFLLSNLGPFTPSLASFFPGSSWMCILSALPPESAQPMPKSPTYGGNHNTVPCPASIDSIIPRTSSNASGWAQPRSSHQEHQAGLVHIKWDFVCID